MKIPLGSPATAVDLSTTTVLLLSIATLPRLYSSVRRVLCYEGRVRGQEMHELVGQFVHFTSFLSPFTYLCKIHIISCTSPVLLER
jgi:hypothetical protein